METYIVYRRPQASWIVYKHTNKYNNKVYIGISKNDKETRWRDGFGYQTQLQFFKDIVKYGWVNFKHEILYKNLNEADAKFIEEDLIYYYKSIGLSYNKLDRGYKHCNKIVVVYDLELKTLVNFESTIAAKYYMLNHNGRIATANDKRSVKNKELGVGGDKRSKSIRIKNKNTDTILIFDSTKEATEVLGMSPATMNRLKKKGSNRKYEML